MANKKRALGRGLSALLENSETDITSNRFTPSSSSAPSSGPVAGSIATIAVADIEANPFQPRTQFSKEALNELAQSIRVHGLIQPVTVRKMGNDKFQLISGERRFRASQEAGLTEVPAYVRIADDQAMLEMALIENIQRENLDAIEVAISYQRLIEECELTQEALAERVGKRRSTVTNYLRLLKLPGAVQLGIRDKSISMGHARALLGIDDPDLQLLIFEKIVNENLSVRKVEDLVRVNSREEGGEKESKSRGGRNPLNSKEKIWLDQLTENYESKIQIQKGQEGKGKIVFHFNDEKELKGLIKKLKH
ncbi:ParB/RepB/Spo0J family partition protein [bacterium SCSIO 12741]|nr:ParB/RepB/Spo0J family partition protein [bacterium SCSIO 12741]